MIGNNNTLIIRNPAEWWSGSTDRQPVIMTIPCVFFTVPEFECQDSTVRLFSCGLRCAWGESWQDSEGYI